VFLFRSSLFTCRFYNKIKTAGDHGRGKINPKDQGGAQDQKHYKREQAMWLMLLLS
jgi:hypothetical protein